MWSQSVPRKIKKAQLLDVDIERATKNKKSSIDDKQIYSMMIVYACIQKTIVIKNHSL